MAIRYFSHIYFISLLIVVLNTLDIKDSTTELNIVQREHFENDLQYCKKCFEFQIPKCLNFSEQVISHNEFDFALLELLNLLPEITCKRNNQYMRLKSTDTKLIAKYFFKANYKLENNSAAVIKREFLARHADFQGIQYAPLKSIDNFVKNIQIYTNFSKATIWQYLLHNIQPLILPLLYEGQFPVPRTYAVCGFTLYQEYGGKGLNTYLKTDFFEKLEIAKQLLEGSLQFSHGFNDYRLYVTDFTGDNIVYDNINKKLYFIDLDNVFIVDGSRAKHKSLVHRLEPLPCSGCFAYSSKDVASYNISDINIYCACKLLREDLHNNVQKGFLYPIPMDVELKFPRLWELINICVDCRGSSCLNRFDVAKSLIDLFEEILKWKLKL